MANEEFDLRPILISQDSTLREVARIVSAWIPMPDPPVVKLQNSTQQSMCVVVNIEAGGIVIEVIPRQRNLPAGAEIIPSNSVQEIRYSLGS